MTAVLKIHTQSDIQRIVVDAVDLVAALRAVRAVAGQAPLEAFVELAPGERQPLTDASLEEARVLAAASVKPGALPTIRLHLEPAEWSAGVASPVPAATPAAAPVAAPADVGATGGGPGTASEAVGAVAPLRPSAPSPPGSAGAQTASGTREAGRCGAGPAGAAEIPRPQGALAPGTPAPAAGHHAGAAGLAAQSQGAHATESLAQARAAQAAQAAQAQLARAARARDFHAAQAARAHAAQAGQAGARRREQDGPWPAPPAGPQQGATPTQTGLMICSSFEVRGERKRFVRAMVAGTIYVHDSEVTFEDSMITGSIVVTGISSLRLLRGMVAGSVVYSRSSTVACPCDAFVTGGVHARPDL